MIQITNKGKVNKMIQITNRGRMWWLLKDKKVVGFASTYQTALAKAREMEGER